MGDYSKTILSNRKIKEKIILSEKNEYIFGKK